MIYLASPYSHSNPRIRELRFQAACRATAQLIRAGHSVFSPIAQGHPLARLGLPTDWAFWQRFDEEHLKRCDELLVLQIEGWRESEGIQAEIALATALGKRIDYVPVENDAVSLSSSAWHHVAPVAHVTGSAATRPSGRIPAEPPTLPVLRDDVANAPDGRPSNA